MSALVSYYSSSDEDDAGGDMDTGSSAHPNPSANIPKSALLSVPSTNPARKLEPEVDGIDNDLSGAPSKLANYLPQPKTAGGTQKLSAVEVGPIPPKKTYGDEELPSTSGSVPGQASRFSGLTGLSATKSSKGTVRISIPSLKDVSFLHI